MSDPPGVPSALGVEAVELLQEEGNVIVRVTGRWRRRRPEWRGPALLVIESHDMRHRFPAMPEPPSLGGTLPASWRMTFSVAAELAPELVGPAWLQLGSLVVPLPAFAEATLRAVADEATAHRLARASAPPEPEAADGFRPWLAPVFKALAATDPIAAGRLVLALLPAQGLVRRLPVAYDLVLGQLVCIQVTVANGQTEVRFGDRARQPSEVQFQLHGDLAALARLLAVGPVRRRLGRRTAKVRGDRFAAAALSDLIRTPLSLHRLHAAGFRLDPGLGLAVCARMIDPAWTVGERFTIAHQPAGARAPGLYLEICDGRPPEAHAEPPAGDPDATIVAPGEGLLPALAGARAENLFTRGAKRPVALMARWLERAQSA